jgi:hypothetical protein
MPRRNPAEPRPTHETERRGDGRLGGSGYLATRWNTTQSVKEHQPHGVRRDTHEYQLPLYR